VPQIAVSQIPVLHFQRPLLFSPEFENVALALDRWNFACKERWHWTLFSHNTFVTNRRQWVDDTPYQRLDLNDQPKKITYEQYIRTCK